MANQPKVSVGYPIEILYPHSNIDFIYGPYDSISDALDAMAVDEEGDSVRAVGLTVGILQIDGSIKEYWFQSGLEDEDLVEKTSGGGSITPVAEITEESTDSEIPSAKAVYRFINETLLNQFINI